MVTPSPPVQLTDLAGSLRRHWHVVAAVAAVGLLIGVAASFLIPGRYDATATVSVKPSSTSSSGTSVDVSRTVSMATEAGIAGSATVAAAAAKDLAPTYRISADKVMAATHVSTPDGSLLLDIRFSGSSAREAVAGADAVAKAYLEDRRANTVAEIARLTTSAQGQINAAEAFAAKPGSAGAMWQRALGVQADSLGAQLADLGNADTDPGQVVGAAEAPTGQSNPGILSLGVAGLFLGLLVGIPVALVKKEDDSEIGGIEGLHAIGDQVVLDGTKDTNRADTWDIAAFMLKIPADIGIEDPFLIMVDADEEPGRSTTAGQELADALSRRGRPARFVDAGVINEGKISRGWPTLRKRESWAGEIVIIDTTTLTSDANKVALATRSDFVLLARSTGDDSAALRRLVGLLKSKSVDIALMTLFPARADLALTHR